MVTNSCCLISCALKYGYICRTRYVRFVDCPRLRSVNSSTARGLSNVAPLQPSYSQPLRPLRGTTCMITGGSSGIGFAIAQRFLREGVGRIIIVGTSKMRLLAAVEKLRSLGTSLWLGREDEKPSEFIGKRMAESKPNTTGQEPLQELGQETQFGSDGQSQSQAPSSSPDDLEVVFDDLAYGTKRCDRPINNITSEPDCELMDLGRFTIARGDVGNPNFWGDMMKKTMDQVDILVNAAGVSYSALLPLAKDEHIIHMLRTNLQGTIFACRTMTRQLLRNKSLGGDNSSIKCIINVSSLYAVKGGIGAATYASTKAGMVALTRAIAAEGSMSKSGSRLRANVILPGFIETRMLDDLSDQVREAAKKSIPLQRFGTAEEVADAAIFLSTNQYANNCILNLDGGLSAI